MIGSVMPAQPIARPCRGVSGIGSGRLAGLAFGRGRVERQRVGDALAAASGSAPAATFAAPHASLLRGAKSRPSSDSCQAIGVVHGLAVPRWRASPSTPMSQPTPTAPGPYWSHISSGTTAMCSSSKAVVSSSTAVRAGPRPRRPVGSRAVHPRHPEPVRSLAGDDLAAGVALELVRPPSRKSPLIGQEPAADALGVRERVPDVVDGRVVVAAKADDAGPRRPAIGRVPTSRWMASICGRCRSWGGSFLSGRSWWRLRSQAALALAAGELRLERVQALGPEPPEVVEPVVDLAERRGVDGVQAARALGTDRGEPAVAQDPQVLRHGGLADPELACTTSVMAPELSSPSARSSRIRRRTGSPRTSNACTGAS